MTAMNGFRLFPSCSMKGKKKKLGTSQIIKTHLLSINLMCLVMKSHYVETDSILIKIKPLFVLFSADETRVETSL